MQDGGLIDGRARATSPSATPLVFRREHPRAARAALRRARAGAARRRRAAPAPPSRRRSTARCSSGWRSRCATTWRRSAAAASRRPASSCSATATARSLAMVGSRDYFDARHAGAVNVTTIRRRPGSTLKPFVYGAGAGGGRFGGDACRTTSCCRERRAKPTPPRSSSTGPPAIASRWPARTTSPPCTRWRGWARRRWSSACAAPA